jgi:hypothetical protein
VGICDKKADARVCEQDLYRPRKRRGCGGATAPPQLGQGSQRLIDRAGSGGRNSAFAARNMPAQLVRERRDPVALLRRYAELFFSLQLLADLPVAQSAQDDRAQRPKNRLAPYPQRVSVIVFISRLRGPSRNPTQKYGSERD